MKFFSKKIIIISFIMPVILLFSIFSVVLSSGLNYLSLEATPIDIFQNTELDGYVSTGTGRIHKLD